MHRIVLIETSNKQNFCLSFYNLFVNLFCNSVGWETLYLICGNLVVVKLLENDDKFNDNSCKFEKQNIVVKNQTSPQIIDDTKVVNKNLGVIEVDVKKQLNISYYYLVLTIT